MRKNKQQIVYGVDRNLGISYFELHQWLEYHVNELHTSPDEIIKLMLKWSETEDVEAKQEEK